LPFLFLLFWLLAFGGIFSFFSLALYGVCLSVCLFRPT
jgi:hypothetical protein